MPSTPEHSSFTGTNLSTLAEFASASNPDGFFSAPVPDDPNDAARRERLRSLGYTTPSLGAFTRVSGGQLLRWSRNVSAGANGEAILGAAPDGGEILVPVVARGTGDYELLVLTEPKNPQRLASLFFAPSSKTRKPRHFKLSLGADSLLLPLQAGPNLIVIGNEGAAAVAVTTIVLTPR